MVPGLPPPDHPESCRAKVVLLKCQERPYDVSKIQENTLVAGVVSSCGLDRVVGRLAYWAEPVAGRQCR